MKSEVDYDDLLDIVMDMQGIEVLLVYLEGSEYFKEFKEDRLMLRAIRNSVEQTKGRVNQLMNDWRDEM